MTFLIFIYIINNNLSRNGEHIMLKTKNLPQCPVETTLMLIGDKWKVLILRDLASGTKRFGEVMYSHHFRYRLEVGASCSIQLLL